MRGTYGGDLGGTFGDPLPFTYGRQGGVQATASAGPRTYGDPLPGRYGNLTFGETVPPDAAPTIEGEYVMTLTDVDGSRRDISGVTSISFTREHTALSDFQATVPADYSLEDWRFSDVSIWFSDRHLFRGSLEQISTDENNGETTLSGRGIGKDLTSGKISVVYTAIKAHEAIGLFWKHQTDFIATVDAPSDVQVIDSLELSGTPLQVAQKLHEYAGMRFVIDHEDADTKAVRSFEPGQVVRSESWDSLNRQRTLDVKDYYNRVVVEGATKSDGSGRYSATAQDDDEVSRVGQVIEWVERDPELTSNADCQNKAQSLLSNLLNKDSVSGSIDTTPTYIPPGYAYVIDEWDDDRVQGPYALNFGHGTNAYAQTKADPSDLGMDGGQPWTVVGWVRPDEHNGGGVWQIGDVNTTNGAITLRIGYEKFWRVDVGPDRVVYTPAKFMDDWQLIAVTFDGTTIQLSVDGSRFASVDVPLDLQPATPLEFGRANFNEVGYLAGSVDDFRIYNRVLSEGELETLRDGLDITSQGLVARYQFDRGAW